MGCVVHGSDAGVVVRRVRKIAKSDCLFRHVCPSVRPLGSHWADFREIRYFSILRKTVGKIQVSLKSSTNNWYFT